MQEPPISSESILDQLGKILSSSLFENAVRSRALLKFVVEQTVSNQAERLKEYTLGVEALGKGDSFDPRTDPIVRAEASRLRARLERYYAAEGRADPLEIALPKGSYVPQFLDRIDRSNLEASGNASVLKSERTELAWANRLSWLVVGVLAVTCAVGIGIWVSQHFARPAESSLVQFDVELKTRGEVGSQIGTDVILSPDGKRLIYVSLGPDGVSRLTTRRLDQSHVTELPETEGASSPFFSPEGRWVGFWASGRLKKTSVDGGSPTILCDSKNQIMGASWGEDDNIIVASGKTLWRISGSRGPPTVIADLARESREPKWPQVLPGAKLVVFTAVGSEGPDKANIEVLSLSTGKRTILAHGGTYGRFLPNGYLTYINQGTLFAMAVDMDRLEARSTPISVLDNMSYSAMFGFAQMDFSRTGSLVYRRGGGGQVIIKWLDGAGKTNPLIPTPGRYFWPSLSPDGERVAVSVSDSGAASLWIYGGQNHTTRLTSATGWYLPLWSPDGRFLILGGRGGLTWLRPDHGGKPERLTNSSRMQIPWSFTPDGKRLAYHETASPTGFDLWTVPIQEAADGLVSGKPEPFLQTPAMETYPAFSTDGRWMAYGSNEAGNWEVYVRAFRDNGTKVRVSSGGGRIARWSPNGRELFYRTDDQRIMMATYTTNGGSFAVSSVRQWSPVRLADTGVLSNFDLSPDGERILALIPALGPEEEQTGNHVTFVFNFFDEVHRRVTSAGR